MLWTKVDKASGLYLMVELASRLEPEEVFQCLAMLSERFSKELDLEAASELQARYPGLENMIQQSLQSCEP